MRNYLILTVAALLLCSCDVKVTIDYAKTTYGFLNHGNFEPGDVLLWDSGKETVISLGNVGCTGKDDPHGNPRDVETRYEYGADVSGDLTKAQIAKVQAEIKSKTSLTAKNMIQVRCRSMITSMTDYIATHPDVMDEWFFRTVAKNSKQYYLFVSDVAFGDSLELNIDKKSNFGASFPVDLATTVVKVNLGKTSLSKFTGNDVSLMFKVRVFRPTFKDNGAGGKNPSFTAVDAPDLRTLPAALRKG